MKKLTPTDEHGTEAEDEMANSKDDEIDEEEEGQDWSQAAKLSNKFMISSIPRRGEKDYEPDGTNVQELLLYRARKAMFDTLENSPRGSIVGNSVKAYYDSYSHCAILPHPKGHFLQTMGSVDQDGRYVLSFQEFVYLAERGTVLPLYRSSTEDIEVPLSMQDLYSLFKTQEEMDRYFIFAHLKRLGFIVTSTEETREKTTFFRPTNYTWGAGITAGCSGFVTLIDSKMTCLMNAFFYTRWNFLFRKYTSTQKFYQGLKNLVPFVRVPKSLDELRSARERNPPRANATFPIAFNVWKPQTSFRKKSPGLADFQIVIYNKNDPSQHFPSYSQLQEIFNSLNYKFDFLSEVDEEVDWDSESFVNGVPRNKQMTTSKYKTTSQKQQSSDRSKTKKGAKHVPSHVKQARRLKSGYRSFLLAVMDDGLISFVRISEADFGSEDVWYTLSKQKGPVRKKKPMKQNQRNQ